LALRKIRYEHGGYGEVSERVRKHHPDDQPWMFTLELLKAQGFGALTRCICTLLSHEHLTSRGGLQQNPYT
jgi:hypothetical protein